MRNAKLVAEWIHFTLFGMIITPTVKLNSAVSLELHFRVRIFDSFFNTIPNKTESAQELSQTPEPHRTQILEDWGFRAFGFSGFSLGFRVWLLGF